MFDRSVVAFDIKMIPDAEIGRRLMGAEGALLVEGLFHVPNAPVAKVMGPSRKT